MNLEIRYLMLPVKDREVSVQFFTGKLGFEQVSNVTIRNRACEALRVSANGPLLVLEEMDADHPDTQAARIVLNTDDCLRDYYRLKNQGVVFLGQPEYLSVGLTVHFTDPSGNVF
ncbi:MAG TPA: VOC family protein, partial [Sphingobacteriaceae bacterium]